MKNIVFLSLFFLSCDNKYKNGQTNNDVKKNIEKRTVNIDGEEYKISGEIDLNEKDEK